MLEKAALFFVLRNTKELYILEQGAATLRIEEKIKENS